MAAPGSWALRPGTGGSLPIIALFALNEGLHQVVRATAATRATAGVVGAQGRRGVGNEGESTWCEEIQLLAVYLVLALWFSFAGVGVN